MTITNSNGATFKTVPIKAGAPYGEYWVEVVLTSGKVIGVGQFDNSFQNEPAAEAWIDQHKEDSDYR